MSIRDIGTGFIIGATLGCFLCSPVWAVNVLSGKLKEDAGAWIPAIWGLFCFLMFLGFCYSAIFEGSTQSIAAALAATLIWLWKSNS
jgi:hypothetical protein